MGIKDAATSRPAVPAKDDFTWALPQNASNHASLLMWMWG